ncbi:tetratricopeptide repeat protein [Streptomyces sp. M19]
MPYPRRTRRAPTRRGAAGPRPRGDRRAAGYDWRIAWHEGLIRLTEGDVAAARAAFERVYGALPGSTRPSWPSATAPSGAATRPPPSASTRRCGSATARRAARRSAWCGCGSRRATGRARWRCWTACRRSPGTTTRPGSRPSGYSRPAWAARPRPHPAAVRRRLPRLRGAAPVPAAGGRRAGVRASPLAAGRGGAGDRAGVGARARRRWRRRAGAETEAVVERLVTALSGRATARVRSRRRPLPPAGRVRDKLAVVLAGMAQQASGTDTLGTLVDRANAMTPMSRF